MSLINESDADSRRFSLLATAKSPTRHTIRGKREPASNSVQRLPSLRIPIAPREVGLPKLGLQVEKLKRAHSILPHISALTVFARSLWPSATSLSLPSFGTTSNVTMSGVPDAVLHTVSNTFGVILVGTCVATV